MFKPSPRAFGVAAAFTIGAVCLAPAASAGLLDGGGSGGNGGLPVPALSGLLAPVQNLLGGDLLGGDLLGGNALGGDLLGGGLLAPVQNLLGGDLLGGGLPLDGLGLPGLGEADSTGGELGDGVLSVVTDTTLACDAAIPQVLSALLLGDLTETICAPFDNGVLGLLGSL